jgi:hypothetical protein
MKLFLAGEGSDELGEWSKELPYRRENGPPGVLEALLRRIAPEGWQITESVQWKRIRKFKSGGHRKPEMRNVLGALLKASEAGCDAFVFLRDRDRDEDRGRDIEQALLDAPSAIPGMQLVGGIAVEELEAWVLAMKGERGSEDHADAKAALAKRHRITTCEGMVEVIESCDLETVPPDARSFRTWVERARQVLPA